MSNQPVATQNQPITFADRATLVAEYGVPVMPLLPRRKQAFLKQWQTLATTDEAKIAKWEKENPDFNCAAVARKGGFWILDVDEPDLSERIVKETGHSLDELDTLVVKSSGAKRHFYFRHDERSEAMGNVDADEGGKKLFSARAHDRYVVGPGSIHPETKQPYEVVSEPVFGEIPVAPKWLIDWILRFKSKPRTPQTSPTTECESIAEGGRDNYLFEQACNLRDSCYPKTVVLAMLRDINHLQCNPPMPDHVVEQKVESAFKRPPRGEVEAAAGAIVRRGDTVKLKRIEWLWENRIPLGKITLFCGNPDNGKSLAATSVAAICTTGREFPDSPNTTPPSDVVMLLGEDDIDDTGAPRFKAAGGDLSKVHFLEGIKEGASAEEREVRLDQDIKTIDAMLAENKNIRLIVIDPISNYLGKASMVAEQEVRRVLIPLKELAARYSVAIILVMHLNKKNELDAINRVGGAMAFIGVARSSWLFQRDEPAEDGTVSDSFSMCRIKTNLTAATHGGLAYTFKTTPIVLMDDKPAYIPYVVWGGVVQKSADAALGAKHEPIGRPKGTDEKHQKAVHFLEEVLRDCGKPADWIFKEGAGTHDLSKSTLRAAADELHVNRGKQPDWVWVLPPMGVVSGDPAGALVTVDDQGAF